MNNLVLGEDHDYNEERLVRRPKYEEGCSSTEERPVPECDRFEFSWSMITNRFGN